MALPTFNLTAGDGFAARVGVTRDELAGAKLVFKTNIHRGGLAVVDDGLELIDRVVVYLDEDGKINGDDGIDLVANDESLNLNASLEWSVSLTGARSQGFPRSVTTWSFHAPVNGLSITLASVMPPPGQGTARGLSANIVSGYFDDDDNLILVNVDGTETTPIELPGNVIAFVDNGDGTVQVG